MAKKNAPEVKNENRTQTKYDRKIEARKQQKLKDARQEKLTKTIAALIGVILIAAIVISTAVSIIKKNTALNGTYVKIGDHELTQLEYDYFYHTTVNNYLNSIASMLPYIGLDTSRDFAEQPYSEDLTWKDMFDEMTVEQIKQNKALVDDAIKTGFEYDENADYENFVSGFKSAADSAQVSVSEYYKTNFGAYATEKNMEPFIREGMFASAYYDELSASNAPSDDEVKAYYEENKQDYDQVDYRSFTFPTDLSVEADEEEISAAMEQIEKEAQAMLEARQKGGDFEALCAEHASEDLKADYEDAETEYSLSQGRYYSGISSVMAQWLYEDGRQNGDITVLRDDINHQCYVVEFVDRYYDEANNENISNVIVNQRVFEYISALVENYQVTEM